MHKYFSYILFCFSTVLSAQSPANDTVYPIPPKTIVDSLLIQTDSSYLASEKTYRVEDLVNDSAYLLQKKFRPDYKEDYSGSDFDYTYERKAKRTLWDKIKEFLRDFFSIKLEPSRSSVDILVTVLKILGYLIIVVAVAFLIKVLLSKDLGRFFGKKPKEVAINVYDVEKNIHQVNFEKLIHDTLHKKNYRLAARYYYLWLLRRLSNAGMIQWNPDKTNADYTAEIKDDGLKISFQYLSYLYNNIWYGEFEINEQEFLKVQYAFQKLLNQYQKYE